MSYLTENLLTRFEDLVANDSGDDISKRNKTGEFHYIPLPMEQFATQMEVLEGLMGARNSDLKFIDVGCGLGTKMVAANAILHCQVFGIEKDPKYVRIARQLLGGKGSRYQSKIPSHAIRGDALKHSYKPYDIIYFYCPMLCDKLQVKLEQRIIATAKKGAYILANLKKDRQAWESDPRVRRVWKDIIYQKV